MTLSRWLAEDRWVYTLSKKYILFLFSFLGNLGNILTIQFLLAGEIARLQPNNISDMGGLSSRTTDLSQSSWTPSSHGSSKHLTGIRTYYSGEWHVCNLKSTPLTTWSWRSHCLCSYEFVVLTMIARYILWEIRSNTYWYVIVVRVITRRMIIQK